MSAAGLRFHGDRLARAGMLDFAVNVWPGARPAWLQRILHTAVDAADRYPDETAAREAVAGRHGRQADEVLLLDGACEAFWLLPAALGPRRAACVHPAFTEPEAALRAAGVRVSRVHRPPEDWRLVPSGVPPDADLVVLGNPNNPTGALDPAATVARLARPGRTLVVDESFIELTEDPAQSLADRRDLPGLVVVRSLTKLWGLAGLRAGYLLAPPEVVAALEQRRQPWSVNSIALAALVACSADAITPPAVGRAVARARHDLEARLADLSAVRVWPASANFLLLHVGGGERIVRRLARRGITVRPAHTFPGLTTDHIRVAVRQPADHARLVAALRAASSR